MGRGLSQFHADDSLMNIGNYAKDRGAPASLFLNIIRKNGHPDVTWEDELTDEYAAIIQHALSLGGDPAPSDPPESQPVDTAPVGAGNQLPRGNLMSNFDETQVKADAEKNWQNDPELRAEFGGDFECYLAYQQASANGQVKRVGRVRADV